MTQVVHPVEGQGVLAQGDTRDGDAEVAPVGTEGIGKQVPLVGRPGVQHRLGEGDLAVGVPRVLLALGGPVDLDDEGVDGLDYRPLWRDRAIRARQSPIYLEADGSRVRRVDISRRAHVTRGILRLHQHIVQPHGEAAHVELPLHLCDDDPAGDRIGCCHVTHRRPVRSLAAAADVSNGQDTGNGLVRRYVHADVAPAEASIQGYCQGRGDAVGGVYGSGGYGVASEVGDFAHYLHSGRRGGR